MVEEVIHNVCANCQRDCKQEYTPWSGCMPPTEYCDIFKRKIGFWKVKAVYGKVKRE